MIKEQEEENLFQNLLETIETKQNEKQLSKRLHFFIRSNPQKQKILAIGTAILKKKKQMMHYHDITDMLIIIIKLLYNLSRQEDVQTNLKKLNVKLDLLKQLLNKKEVSKWVQGLKQQIQKLIYQQNQHKQGRNNQYLAKLFQDIKSCREEKDKQIENIRSIAFCFYDYSQIQSQINNPDFCKKLINKINTLKSQVETNSTKLKEQCQIKKRIELLTNKYSLKNDNNNPIDRLQQYILEIRSENGYLNERIQQYKNNSVQKARNIAELRLKIQKYQQQIKSCQNKIKDQQLLSNHQITSTTFLFQSSIITPKNYLRQIAFLRQKINKMANIDGIRCKLLYSTEHPKSKQNFHLYFDNKPNILLLIKLKTGLIIGGFSHEQFKENCDGKLGFIFNFSRMETYELQKKSTITYDCYYIIFGNSQICIKTNDMVLFSNFGISSAHFNSKGRNIDSFLNNEGSREVEMEGYQILQVQEQQII